MSTFYFHDGQAQQGPFTIGELKSKRITPSTQVWAEGMENWQKAEDVAELRPLFNGPPPLPKTELPKGEKTARVFEKTADVMEKGMSIGRKILLWAVVSVCLIALLMFAGFWFMAANSGNSDSESSPVTIIVNPPNPQVISDRAGEDESSSLFEYVMFVDGTVTNTGGEGNILVQARVKQNGNDYERSEEAYMQAGESRDFHFVFKEAELGGKRVYSMVARPLK